MGLRRHAHGRRILGLKGGGACGCNEAAGTKGRASPAGASLPPLWRAHSLSTISGRGLVRPAGRCWRIRREHEARHRAGRRHRPASGEPRCSVPTSVRTVEFFDYNCPICRRVAPQLAGSRSRRRRPRCGARAQSYSGVELPGCRGPCDRDRDPLRQELALHGRDVRVAGVGLAGQAGGRGSRARPGAVAQEAQAMAPNVKVHADLAAALGLGDAVLRAGVGRPAWVSRPGRASLHECRSQVWRCCASVTDAARAYGVEGEFCESNKVTAPTGWIIRGRSREVGSGSGRESPLLSG